MPYNLFISHSWTYGDSYDRLIEMLDDAPNFYYKDYSVPKNDPIHNDGISGTNTAKRDEFNRMIADCEAGKIEIKTAELIQFDFSGAATF